MLQKMFRFQLGFKDREDYKTLIKHYPDCKKVINRAFMRNDQEFIVGLLHELADKQVA